MAMPDYLCAELDEKGIRYSFSNSLEEVIPHIDVLYMTRIQRERFDEEDFKKIRPGMFILISTTMLEKNKRSVTR